MKHITGFFIIKFKSICIGMDCSHKLQSSPKIFWSDGGPPNVVDPRKTFPLPLSTALTTCACMRPSSVTTQCVEAWTTVRCGSISCQDRNTTTTLYAISPLHQAQFGDDRNVLTTCTRAIELSQMPSQVTAKYVKLAQKLYNRSASRSKLRLHDSDGQFSQYRNIHKYKTEY